MRITSVLSLMRRLCCLGGPSDAPNLGMHAAVDLKAAVHFLNKTSITGLKKQVTGLSARMQISFWELLGNTFEDFTIIVLVISGLLSIALELAFGDGDHGWVEGAAILAAVAVVALVTAVNDFEKEKQFRDLSALSSESQVGIPPFMPLKPPLTLLHALSMARMMSSHIGSSSTCGPCNSSR